MEQMIAPPKKARYTPGKFRAVSRLCDEGGRFKMVAVDQRAPMRGLLADALGHAPSFSDMTALKRMLTEHLRDGASALLIDPDYGLAAALELVPSDLGLIVSLEDSNYSVTPGGRRPGIVPNWSVEKIKRLGADGVKYLIWYSPNADPEVREYQFSLIKRLGEECKRYDLAFLLEILVYPHAESEESFARNRTGHVLDSVDAFADPAFGVDIYKLESPISPADLSDDPAAHRDLQELFVQMTGSLNAPWVMLSAGAHPADFIKILRCAYAAGSSGFLAGRSIWASAAKAYPDEAEVSRLLTRTAIPYLEELNRLTDESARPVDCSVILPEVSGASDFPRMFPGF